MDLAESEVSQPTHTEDRKLGLSRPQMLETSLKRVFTSSTGSLCCGAHVCSDAASEKFSSKGQSG